FRYVKEPDIFRLECRAIKKVREEYKLTNVHVMLPFVRTLEDFRNARKILEEEGLKRGPDFKLWIMVEVPATVLLIDKFVDEGIDGISFGTNDLTMLILGIDRDDASIQEIYDERNLAVLRAMRHVIRVCSAKDVTTSIVDQTELRRRQENHRNRSRPQDRRGGANISSPASGRGSCNRQRRILGALAEAWTDSSCRRRCDISKFQLVSGSVPNLFSTSSRR